MRPEDLIGFLNRHAAVPIVFAPQPVSQPPDTIILTVEKPTMAQALLRLSGIRYAGNKVPHFVSLCVVAHCLTLDVHIASDTIGCLLVNGNIDGH